MSAREEDVDYGDGGEGDGAGDVANAGADDGRCISRDGRRGTRDSREVEGENVEDREGHLGKSAMKVNVWSKVWQHEGCI